MDVGHCALSSLNTVSWLCHTASKHRSAVKWLVRGWVLPNNPSDLKSTYTKRNVRRNESMPRGKRVLWEGRLSILKFVIPTLLRNICIVFCVFPYYNICKYYEFVWSKFKECSFFYKNNNTLSAMRPPTVIYKSQILYFCDRQRP